MCIYRDTPPSRFIYEDENNYAQSIVFLVIFGLIFVAQLVQGIYWKQWWFAAWWCCGCGLQVATLASRIAERYTSDILRARTVNLVCLVLAPAFQLIGIYYLMSKLITIYGRRYSLIAPTTGWLVFTGAGAIAIPLLGAGAGVYVSNGYHYGYCRSYLSTNVEWVLAAGFFVQFTTMTAFSIFLCVLTHRIRVDKERNYNPEWQQVRSRYFFSWLLPVIFVATLCFYVQTICRTINLVVAIILSSDGSTPFGRNSVASLVFDSIAMVLASLVLPLVYPGTCLGSVPIPIWSRHNNVERATCESFSDMDARPSDEIISKTPVIVYGPSIV